ncbi:cytochrome P450 [Poronia punctata]|nr:cytochrome P450 [Poronia punctata]
MAFVVLVGESSGGGDKVVAGFGAVIIGYLILCAAVYRVLLHPLRTYPGPLLAKVTDWYAGLQAFEKITHLRIYENHDKYGPVVRLGPNRLVFNTAQALHDIYQNDAVSKSYTYDSTVRNGKHNVFTVQDKKIHRSKRRLVGSALTERAARIFEPVVLDQVDIYLRQLYHHGRKEGEAINYTARAKWLAIDIVGLLSFGYDLSTQTREENRFMSRSLGFGLHRGNVWHYLYFLNRFWVDGVFDHVFYGFRERYFRLLEKMITSRVAREKEGGGGGGGGDDERRDFFSFIAEMEDVGNSSGSGGNSSSVRKGELWGEANLLIIAGSDTTSAALSAVMFYLSRHPTCYARLASEIRSVFSDGRDIKSGPRLASCTYLRACIDEAMRMSPPVPATLWREQDPQSPSPHIVIDGHVVPKGTLFGVSTYALHHNEEYFPDSFTFKPERWLDHDDTNSNKKAMHAAFSPFSVGSRSCAGKPLAYMESSVVLAKTMWYFDFERAEGELGDVGAGKLDGPSGRERPGEFQLEDVFTARHDGPYLVFKPRGELWKDFEA